MKKVFEMVGMVGLMGLIGLAIYHFVLAPLLVSSDKVEANIGDSFYATSLLDHKGEQQSLAQYKGKTIIVNFWATWCAPCREEMPELSALHKKLAAKNVIVLGLAIDEMEQVNVYQEETPVSYPLLIAEVEGMVMAADLGNKKGVLPYTAIVGPKGEVIKTFYGKVDEGMLLKALPIKQ